MLLKNNFIVLKLKRNFISLLFLLFTISILIFSNTNLSAVKSGINLWATSVVPSLFPFFVATELLMHTNIVYHIGNILNRFMKPLFNVRGEGAFAFIMGIISGYPIGAKIATNFREQHICTKEECERLLSFTNNSGPLFIIGTCGITLFGSSVIGFLLFFNNMNVLNFVFLITSIKIGLCGLAFSFFIKHRFKRLKNIHVIMLSIAYSFTQYVVGQMANIMWLDGVYMLPIILYFIEIYFEKNKKIGLYISFICTIIFNW